MHQFIAFLNTGFTAGPTLADAVLVGVARWRDFHGVADPSRWPRLAALRQRLENDPAVKYATALEAGASPPGSGLCKGHVPLQTLISTYGK